MVKLFELYNIETAEVLGKGIIDDYNRVVFIWDGSINSIVIHKNMQDFMYISVPDDKRRIRSYYDEASDREYIDYHGIKILDDDKKED